MQAFCLSVAVLLVSLCECVQAEKLTLAHVAVNPSQGIFWVAKDSGILAKYGFTADIVLIPGTPRTVQALIAGDLDYAVAGSPAALTSADARRRCRYAGRALQLSVAASFVRKGSTVQNLNELKGKLVGVTQFGSAGDTFFRSALKKVGLRDSGRHHPANGWDTRSLSGAGGRQDRSLRPWGIGHDAGLSRNSAAIERRERARAWVQASGWTSQHHRAKIKADRGAVLRVVQAYVEAIHYVKTNNAGTIRIFQRYMRGLQRRGSRHVVGRLSRELEIRALSR